MRRICAGALSAAMLAALLGGAPSSVSATALPRAAPRVRRASPAPPRLAVLGVRSLSAAGTAGRGARREAADALRRAEAVLAAAGRAGAAAAEPHELLAAAIILSAADPARAREADEAAARAGAAQALGRMRELLAARPDLLPAARAALARHAEAVDTLFDGVRQKADFANLPEMEGNADRTFVHYNVWLYAQDDREGEVSLPAASSSEHEEVLRPDEHIPSWVRVRTTHSLPGRTLLQPLPPGLPPYAYLPARGILAHLARSRGARPYDGTIDYLESGPGEAVALDQVGELFPELVSAGVDPHLSPYAKLPAERIRPLGAGGTLGALL